MKKCVCVSERAGSPPLGRQAGRDGLDQPEAVHPPQLLCYLGLWFFFLLLLLGLLLLLLLLHLLFWLLLLLYLLGAD